MTRVRGRRGQGLRGLVGLLRPDVPSLLFAFVVTGIIAIGVAATRDETPSTYRAPTLAVAQAPLICTSGPLTVAWSIGPLDGVTTPKVTGVTLYGLSADCARYPVTVSLTDGTGAVLASKEASANTAVDGVLVVRFDAPVAVPPIEGIAITVPDTLALAVAFGGPGSGSVTSGEGLGGIAIDCPAVRCSTFFDPGDVVTLRAATGGTEPASRFDGWRGAVCTEGDQTRATCTFTITAPTTVTALFGIETAIEIPPLTTPGPIEFTAGQDFGFLVGEGTAGTRTIVVRLLRLADVTASTAVGALPFEATEGTLVVDISVFYLDNGEPVPGPYTICLAGNEPDRLWHFFGGAWSDVSFDPPADYSTGSDGVARVCGRVASLSPFAVASWSGPRTLTVNVTGSGSVSAVPPGPTYPVGTEVTLTATPDPGWTFAGWTGRFCAGTGSCVVRMNADRTVGATFTRTFGGGGGVAAAGVTLRRSAGTIVFGGAVTLSTRLAPVGAAVGSGGYVGRTVALERSTGTGWTRIATLVTGVDGTAATRIRPIRNADYRVVFAGDGAVGAATSAVGRVNVRYAVALRPKVGRAPVTIGRTGYVDLVATVRPEPTAGSVAGSVASPSVARPRVTFDLFLRVGTRWSLLTRTTVAANARGIATWRFRPPASGRWAIRAAARTSSSNFESVFTPLLEVRVR